MLREVIVLMYAQSETLSKCLSGANHENKNYFGFRIRRRFTCLEASCVAVMAFQTVSSNLSLSLLLLFLRPKSLTLGLLQNLKLNKS